MGPARRRGVPGGEARSGTLRGSGNRRPPHPLRGCVGGVVRPSRRKLAEGDRIGSWRLLEYDRAYWLCECECRKLAWVSSGNLNQGKSTSCVLCSNRRLASARSAATRLGIPQKDYDRLANRMYAARRRCEDPKDAGFANYGGRGITFDFSSIEAAVGHLVTLPGWDNPTLELDRKDNHRGYFAGNLRFVNRSGNASNTRANRRIRYLAREYTAEQFWRKFASRYRDSRTVTRKIQEGKTAEQIIAEQRRCRGPYLRRTKRRAP